MKREKFFLATLLFCGMCCLWAQASSFTFITPPGSSVTGGPVDASATFTISSGTIQITLTNLLANPHDVGQGLSDLSFTVGNGTVTGASFASSGNSATAISINGSGIITATAPLTTAGAIGWVLSEPTSTQVLLDVLSGTGHAGPAHTMIGPPNVLGVYSNANHSIAGNGPHNPFIEPTATWVINAPNVGSGTTITSATFSFGTTPGVTITGTRAPVPEPGTLSMLGTGLMIGLVGMARRKLKLGT